MVGGRRATAPASLRRAAHLGRTAQATRRRARELDLGAHALALGAQQMLCTAPLVIAIASVFQSRADRGLAYATVRFFDLHGAPARAVTTLLRRDVAAISLPALVMSLAIAAVFAVGMGATQQRVFEVIWHQPRMLGRRAWLRQVGWTVALAAFAVGLLAAARLGVAVEATPAHALAGTAVTAVRTVAVIGFYWWSQWWLLAGRVRCNALLPGAVAIGVAALVVFALTPLVLPGQIVWQARAYGQIGVVFVLATWLTLASTLVFAGALFGALLRSAGPWRVDERSAAISDGGTAR